MEHTTIIAAIIGSISIIIVAIIKFKPKNNSNTVDDYIKKDIDRLCKHVDKLYNEIDKSHAEGDKIMGLIADIRERIAKLEVR